MGIVRRIAPRADGRTIAGLELLGESAIAVTLHPQVPPLSAETASGGQLAVLLSRRPDPEGTIELLLIPDGLTGARVLQMLLEDRIFQLQLISQKEQGPDYLRARYRLRHSQALKRMPPGTGSQPAHEEAPAA